MKFTVAILAVLLIGTFAVQQSLAMPQGESMPATSFSAQAGPQGMRMGGGGGGGPGGRPGGPGRGGGGDNGGSGGGSAPQ